jgi:hypothetical protein
MSTSPERRWSRRAEWFDWVVVGAALVLGGMTVWTASALIRGPWDRISLSLAWGIVGAAWSIAVVMRTTDRLASAAALGLLGGSLVTLLMFGPIGAVVFLGSAAVLAAGLVGLGLFAVILARERARRLVWLLAPAITVAALAVDLSGLPQSLRFAAVEPQLAAFVATARTDGPLPSEDEPLDVAGMPVYDVIVEAGQVRLVTGYIGILGDDAAGIVYVDQGSPVGVARTDHLGGHWYRWYPY